MVVADIVRLQNLYHLIGFIDDINMQRHGTKFCDASILGGKEQLAPLLQQGVKHVLLGFGDCQKRLEFTGVLLRLGFLLPTVIHPSAVVAGDSLLGLGTVIAAGGVVNPGVQVGCSVIINTAASVDHECIIGDAAHVCPGARLGGGVILGEAAQVGIGATVVDRVRIGAGVVIGAGAVVVSDIPDHVVAYGVPAKVIRTLDR